MRQQYLAWCDRVRFTLQVNDPSADILDALSEYRSRPDPRVTLIDRAMNRKEYSALLASSDVVLVPYHSELYRERTSGIFLEAVTSGKVVVCTEDTWMSDLLKIRGGGVLVANRSASKLCAAIGEVVAKFELLSDRAKAAAPVWRKVHSPDALAACIFDKAGAVSVVPRPSCAAVIYPWGDAATGRSGSSERLKLLVKYLECHYDEVRILFAGASENGGLIATRSAAKPYHYMRFRNRLLYAALSAMARAFGGKEGSAFHLWFHLWPYIDGKFKSRCKEIVAWADDVYVEYSYFAPIVDRFCREGAKRIILTQYDIVSKQSEGIALIHPLTRWFEFRALKRVSQKFVVTEDDREYLAKKKIRAEVIPHPIDVDASETGLDEVETNAILTKLLHIPAGEKRICFFVGSSYEPNKVAAGLIREMAIQMRKIPDGENVVFVVAGGCMALT